MPRQELAARATAQNQDVKSFRLRHTFLRITYAIGERFAFAGIRIRPRASRLAQ
jgi:hypothetical protein